MVQFSYAGQSININEDDLMTLYTLLPYWGLTINENKEISGLQSRSDIRISGLSDRTLKELNQYISHTGIIATYSDDPEFVITFKESSSAPISIRVHFVTYRFHPTSSIPAERLQDYIFKKLWLPKRVVPIHITIDSSHRSRSVEWLSYLLIQYATAPLKFKSLTSLSLEDYQYFVEEYLIKINPQFATTQKWTVSETDEWPDFPDKPSFLAARNLFDDPDDRNEDPVDDSSIRPFRKSQDQVEPQPINPFKKGKQEQSVINPFRKK